MKKTNTNPKVGRPKLTADKLKFITVPVKYDLDRYEKMMNKVAVSGMNRSEYIRHSSTHCKVVPRLTPRDLKAIRDLQGLAENLNRVARFCAAILKGGDNTNVRRTMDELMECKNFVLSLINNYRNTPAAYDGEDS